MCPAPDDENVCPICLSKLDDSYCWYPCCKQHNLHIECYLKSALLYKSQCPIDRRYIRYVKYNKSVNNVPHNVYLSAGHMKCDEKLYYFWQQISTNRLYKGLFANFWSTENFLPFVICLKRRNYNGVEPRYVSFKVILVHEDGSVEIVKDQRAVESIASYVVCLETYVTDEFIEHDDLTVEAVFDVDILLKRFSFHISIYRSMHRETLAYFVNNEMKNLAV